MRRLEVLSHETVCIFLLLRRKAGASLSPAQARALPPGSLLACAPADALFLLRPLG